MQVHAEIVLFPYGAREGLPALAVDITGAPPLPTLDDLIPLTEPLRMNQPGVTIVWLRSAPWGSYEWDKRLHAWTAEAGHMSFAAAAVYGGVMRTNLGHIAWVVDVSAQLAEPTTVQVIQRQAMELATEFRPAVQEIIVHYPHPSNLRAPILAELAKMWETCNGTIILPMGEALSMKAALVAASSTGIFAVRCRA